MSMQNRGSFAFLVSLRSHDGAHEEGRGRQHQKFNLDGTGNSSISRRLSFAYDKQASFCIDWRRFHSPNSI